MCPLQALSPWRCSNTTDGGFASHGYQLHHFNKTDPQRLPFLPLPTISKTIPQGEARIIICLSFPMHFILWKYFHACAMNVQGINEDFSGQGYYGQPRTVPLTLPEAKPGVIQQQPLVASYNIGNQGVAWPAAVPFADPFQWW